MMCRMFDDTKKKCQGQMRWIRIDEKYPVKISK